MKTHIEAYLRYHENAWAPTTMRTARSILKKVEDHIDTPEELHRWLTTDQSCNFGAYTVHTMFIRVRHLESWAQLEPLFKTYMATHRNKFINAYVKKEVKVTYDEALARINQLDPVHRGHALSLLSTGLRISESYAVQDDGLVKGKGGKIRRVYGKISKTVPKTTLWRKLRNVGLKPHDLRKLFATRLVERGATAADLCKVMGWSDIRTAYQYLQAKDEARLESLVASCKEES